MLYVPLIFISALAAAAMTKRSPQGATRLGVFALASAVIAVAIAELTGNLLLFYLGSALALFGVVLLLFRLGTAFRSHKESPY